MNILNSKSLINHNTFKVDASAKFFINVKSENDIIELLQEKKFKTYKKFILGGGSNILFTKNINGIVIHNQIKGINIQKETENEIVIEIGAGEIWDKVVEWSVGNNLYGIDPAPNIVEVASKSSYSLYSGYCTNQNLSHLREKNKIKSFNLFRI